jgi:hypothetical protein
MANTRILRYPYEALTEKTDYLQIDAKSYTAISQVKDSGGGLVGRRPREDVSLSGKVDVPKTNDRPVINEGTVFLPIPSNIQDGNAVGYGDDSLNGLTAAAVSDITDLVNSDPTKPTTFQGPLKNLLQLGLSEDVRKTLARSMAAQAVNVFSGNVTPDQILARQSGEIFNPNMELLFNGVTLRAFKFQFKLTPRDKNEASEIRNIIRFFKYNMSPQAGTLSPDKPTYFLRTPNVFQLTYKKGNGIHPFLHSFKLCALESMTVNYTGENVYATYEDGEPVSMIMDLSFKELEPIYASDYDVNENGVGY